MDKKKLVIIFFSIILVTSVFRSKSPKEYSSKILCAIVPRSLPVLFSSMPSSSNEITLTLVPFSTLSFWSIFVLSVSSKVEVTPAFNGIRTSLL